MFGFVDVSASTHLDSAGGIRSVSRAGICLHSTGGVDSRSWLQRVENDPAKRSSADYLISTEGLIQQITPIGRYAYHAGKARWRAWSNVDQMVNMLLVGVEVECLDTLDSRWTDPQYIAVGALLRALVSRHRLPVNNLVTHAEIAVPPGRKTDPLVLSWPVLTRELLYPSWQMDLYKFPAVMA